jgi:hypothetical protein
MESFTFSFPAVVTIQPALSLLRLRLCTHSSGSTSFERFVKLQVLIPGPLGPWHRHLQRPLVSILKMLFPALCVDVVSPLVTSASIVDIGQRERPFNQEVPLGYCNLGHPGR